MESHHIYPKYSDSHTCVNSGDHVPAVLDQSLGSQMNLFKF